MAATVLPTGLGRGQAITLIGCVTPLFEYLQKSWQLYSIAETGSPWVATVRVIFSNGGIGRRSRGAIVNVSISWCRIQMEIIAGLTYCARHLPARARVTAGCARNASLSR
jgi:hypothetical protein